MLFERSRICTWSQYAQNTFLSFIRVIRKLFRDGQYYREGQSFVQWSAITRFHKAVACLIIRHQEKLGRHSRFHARPPPTSRTMTSLLIDR